MSEYAHHLVGPHPSQSHMPAVTQRDWLTLAIATAVALPPAAVKAVPETSAGAGSRQGAALI